jgi:hypothetical protein
MRLRDEEMPFDPEIERELEAIDRALAGLEARPGLEELAELALELRAGRPAPEAPFAAELDEWAAAGFPPRHSATEDQPPSPTPTLARLRDRLAAVPPRRLLVPGGAAATLLVAIGVGIAVSDQLGGGRSETPQAVSTERTTKPSGGVTGALNAAPSQGKAGRIAPAIAPNSTQDALPQARVRERSALGGGPASAHPVPPGQRKVAQQADLALSTEPEDVRDVADGVVQVVDRYRGFVVRSSVTSGDGGRPEPRPANGGIVPPAPGVSGATFHLKLPARNLQAALADLSALAHVSSRTENVKDITNRFTAAEERVKGLEAQRDTLLRRLGRAVTISEQESIKSRLHLLEQQLATARRELADVRQRIHLVPMNVQILGQEGVNGGGSWSLGDAAHDAGRVLAVTAGVLLIAAAVLGPLALLAVLAWLLARIMARRRRERALDQA